MSVIEGLGDGYAHATAVARAAASRQPICETVDLLAVPEAAWLDLANRAAEPNVFFHPAWARAVSRHAEGKSGAKALLAWSDSSRSKLIGLLPVVSAWRALKLPIPVLVAWEGYARLTTPLIDRAMLDEGARGLVAAAREAGAYALMLPAITSDGPAAVALRRAIAEFGIEPRTFNDHERARLDATQDADAVLAPLGSKKLKELRRQRNRLADAGEVSFRSVTSPDERAAALDAFLKLESSGWKGARGTALGRRPGDTKFVREAMAALIAAGSAEIAVLSRGQDVVAAGLILRHLRRGYFFKIAYDETLSKTSPGVQITLDISRHLCADGQIDDVDSTAVADHPMIDHVWRSRLAVCDLIVPVRRNALSFSLMSSLIVARHALREAARRAFHALRSLKGKSP